MYDMVLKKAFEVLKQAYAPYSGFRVGACIETLKGQYYLGTNIENASYSLTMCAERNAVFAAYTHGVRKEHIKALAIVTYADNITPPCGACAQVLSELLLCDTPIILSNQKEIRMTTIKQLLPMAFTSEDLL